MAPVSLSSPATNGNGAAPKRPVRVAGASGGFSDRVRAIASLAANEDVDVIVGDWLSELTMTIHGTGKLRNKEEMTKAQTFEEKLQFAMFAENFMDCFEPAMESLAKRGVKLAVNAGASDTELLAQLVQKKVQERGYNLKVAWIEGDDATGAVQKLLEEGEEFRSLMHNKSIKEWGLEPVVAQCYMGGLGIARALTEGADIVICGRVSDASPIIGAAAYVALFPLINCELLANSSTVGGINGTQASSTSSLALSSSVICSSALLTSLAVIAPTSRNCSRPASTSTWVSPSPQSITPVSVLCTRRRTLVVR